MVSSAMPWIKLYTDFLDDRKIARLPEAAQLLFVKLLLIAGECDAEGYLIDSAGIMGFSDIAWRLRSDKNEIAKGIGELNHAGLIDQVETENGEAFLITNFSKRQGRSQSEKREQWRQRQQKHRGKQGGDSEGDNRDDPQENPPDELPDTSVSHANVTGDEDVSHTNVTPPEESRGEEEERFGANAPPHIELSRDERTKIRNKLTKHFLTKTGLPAPKTRTDRDLKEAQRLWWTPWDEIVDLACGDPEQAINLIDEAVLRLKGMTISDPNSIIKTVRAVFSEKCRKPASGLDDLQRQGYSYVN